MFRIPLFAASHKIFRSAAGRTLPFGHTDDRIFKIVAAKIYHHKPLVDMSPELKAILYWIPSRGSFLAIVGSVGGSILLPKPLVAPSYRFDR